MEGNKIKLVLVIADSEVGGGPNHILGILRNIDQKIFDVSLICPKGYLSSEAKKDKGINVYTVPMENKFDLSSFVEIRNIISCIRSKENPFGPLIIHSHGSRAGFLARLFRIRGTKQVYTEHRFDADFHLKNKLNEWVQKEILKLLNNRSDRIVAVSSSVKQFLMESGTDEKRIVRIPNGVELPVESKSMNQSSVDRKAPIIGNIGNLNIQKGQRYLIEAMPNLIKKYPLLTLEIIGEGSLRNELKLLTKQLKIERHVSFLGRQKSVGKYLKHWSVFVLPSVAETFGIAILEAMESGTPVVASKVGGIPDIITNRINGLLIRPKDPKAIEEAVLELLDHPVLAAKLKRAGKERVKDFEWRNIVKKLEEEYISLLK